MTHSFTRAAQIAAITLIATVVTQMIYIAISRTGAEPPRDIIWSLETIVFVVSAIAGLALCSARPVIGSGIAIGGIFNTIQAGMGLVMFPPLMAGGDALSPVFTAVLAMAFVLYFAAKIAIGVAGIAAAVLLWPTGGAGKIIGTLAGVTGLAAVALNTAAILPATDLTFPAGAAGTAAAALLALALLVMKAPSAE